MTEKRKIQIVLDKDAQETLAALQKATNAESQAHVVRDALGVYQALHELLAGRPELQLAIVNRDEGDLQELLIPSLRKKQHVVVTRPRPATDKQEPESVPAHR